MYKSLCGHVFSFLLGKHVGMKLLDRSGLFLLRSPLRAASYSSEFAASPLGKTLADLTPSFISSIAGHVLRSLSVLSTVLYSGETEMNK